MMEVVFELRFDDARRDRDDADPPAVRVGIEIEVGNRRVLTLETHERVPVSVPLAAPGYAPPPNCASSAS